MLPRQKASIFRETNFTGTVSQWMKNFAANEEFLGGFFDDGTTVWVAQQSSVLVFDSRSGEKIAHYRFETGLKIDCAVPCRISESFQGLLIGVCTSSQSLLCVFDIMANRLLSATVVPYRVLSLCVIMDGGQSISGEHMRLNTDLKKLSSIVAIGTVGGHVYLFDANLHVRKAISNETSPCIKHVCNVEEGYDDNGYLVDITAFLRPSRDLIQWPDTETASTLVTLESATVAATALYYSIEAAMLVIGFSFGGVLFYSLECLEALQQTIFEPCAAAVMKFAIVEPEDDPKATLYLWTLRDSKVCSVDRIETGQDKPSLEMYQLNFRERQRYNSCNRYVDWLQCVSRMYWVPDSCYALVDCTTLETWSESGKVTPADYQRPTKCRIFMYFSWIHKSGMLVGCLFDINSWYHAQMPHTVLALSEYRVCPFVAWHYLEISREDRVNPTLICSPAQCSVVRYRQTPDTQFNYFACSYSLEMDVMTTKSLRRLQVPDVQSLVLDDVVQRTMEALGEPKDFVSALQMVRLVPTFAEDSTAEDMRRCVWTAMLENGRFHYLADCFSSIMVSDPVLLDEFMEWAWWQAITSKSRFDEICGVLFDEPTLPTPDVGRNGHQILDEQTKRILWKESANLDLLLKAHSLWRARFLDSDTALQSKLHVRESALKETCLYARIVVWFVDNGILPETEGYYARRAIEESHRNAAKLVHGNERGLFIDKLASELNECLKKGPVEGLSAVNYPLGTFRYVLSSYLIAGADPIAKHAFVYYTLLDIESSSVDDVVEENSEKFAKQILLNADPLLPTYVSMIWHLDKGEDMLASGFLIDALASWSDKTSLKDRFAEAVKEFSSRNSLSPSLSFALPLPFEHAVERPVWKRTDLHWILQQKTIRTVSGVLRANAAANISLGLDRSKNSSFQSTPMKRGATITDDELLRTVNFMASTKKARYEPPKLAFTARSVSRAEDSDEESHLGDVSNIEDARRLLKVPATHTPRLDVSSFSRAPVSILKKRTQGGENSSYMEKSIRFALPPEPQELSESSSILVGASIEPHSPDVNANSESVRPKEARFYTSPTDPEIVLNFTRNRWSLANAPSPPDNGDSEGSDQSNDSST